MFLTMMGGARYIGSSFFTMLPIENVVEFYCLYLCTYGTCKCGFLGGIVQLTCYLTYYFDLFFSSYLFLWL